MRLLPIALVAAALVVTGASPALAAPRSGASASANKARRQAAAADKLVAEGRWVEATALLRSEAEDPARSAAVRKKAAAALDALEKRIPHVSLEVPATFKGTIAVDGTPLEVAKWPAPIALDPGEHVVTTRVGIASPTRYPITLRERERHVLALADEGASATTATSGATTTERDRPREGGAPWRTVGFVGLGAGLLTLGAGGVLAVMASNEKSALEGRCPNDVCPESARADFDSGRSKANLATFALAGGAVLTAASVALVVFGPQKKEDSRVELRASAAGVSLKGQFQ